MSILLPQREPCPLCENIQGHHPCAFLARDHVLSSFINPRQYGKGGILIVPNRHAATILDLDPHEIAAIYLHAQEITRALLETYALSGCNIFQNNGVSAGQTVPHFHVHVVPRYPGEEAARIFGEHHFPKIPMEERLRLAEEIRHALRHEELPSMKHDPV
ncbi:MAG: HIT family protein [Candidatus Babeliaceae bacterium]|nr:HIT family protein [Candidatus Babeliaceae bacterium]